MAEQEEKKATEQVEQNTDQVTEETTQETTTDTTVEETKEQTEEAPEQPGADKPAEQEKPKKKSSKTIGYAAAYIGKGGQPQVLAGSSKRKKDAERKLRENGVSKESMRVTPIKE
ncbi:hypothetical protein [Carboxylicivirga marina]|uniref:Uncharacterized protein n=1 Tax=Carboxylicivirga marina TaxID=2800988 RepID=A0ABS1HGA1_9BACT|nr:hypothetical protein [Carboxylicivirga marina]MBK3516699.1 hypothetical protein [Carboxylicivirga marina]